MADNYLEKRMEEYRAGKLAPKVRRVVHTSSAPVDGALILNFPMLNVVIIGGGIALLSETVRRFRSVGARVAICHSDNRLCTPLAQSCSCRYYPFDENDASRREAVLADVEERWGGVDVAVDLRECQDEEVAREMAENMAMLTVIHSHPRLAIEGSYEFGL